MTPSQKPRLLLSQRAFDFALKSVLAACALAALLAVCATYLCAVGAMPCRDATALERCPYDDAAHMRGSVM